MYEFRKISQKQSIVTVLTANFLQAEESYYFVREIFLQVKLTVSRDIQNKILRNADSLLGGKGFYSV
jgi:hypothetical protein